MTTEGDTTLASIFIILDPRPSIPVAFEESSLLIYDETCSQVIRGIVKYVLFGIFVLTKSLNLSNSNVDTSSLSSCMISEMVEKYTFNLVAIFLEFVKVSSFITSSVGRLFKAAFFFVINCR